jgi:hypothetical protein
MKSKKSKSDISSIYVSKKTPKRITQSIKRDGVHPTDYIKYVLLSACEDCSHFDAAAERCTFGYNSAHHRRAQQLKDYEMSGKMALCRFLEID